ncbi:MAG: PilZ domain-containing protein [Deltaproteobacteria bacterium]|nr:PilZ domain-containing protein [Deltaproteobacteria bacterium]
MTDKDPREEEPKDQTDPEEEKPAEDDADRRKHPRVKAKLHMVYEDGRTSFKTRVIDISLGGVFLEMEKPPEAGTEIRLTPVLPDQGPNEPATQIRGRVVRVVEYDLENFPHPRTGIGVEFSDISDGEQSLLSNIFREGLRELKEDEVEEDESSCTGEWQQLSEDELEKDPPGGKS